MNPILRINDDIQIQEKRFDSFCSFAYDDSLAESPNHLIFHHLYKYKDS